MPDFSRRGVLQVLGAVGLTPLLPVLPTFPARAAVTGGGHSASKALWASLYANAGSGSEFVNVARNMGLSNAAIQGVSARTIGVRMVIAASSEKLAGASARTAYQPISVQNDRLQIRSKLKRTLNRYFSDKVDDTKVITDQEAEANPLEKS